MASSCSGTVTSFDAASQYSENMFTQIKTTPKPSTPVFVISGDPEPSTTFVAGQCVCKTCRSKDLTFYRYLDDAKCDSCSQWQNEEPIAD
jgi:hypothetical protein